MEQELLHTYQCMKPINWNKLYCVAAVATAAFAAGAWTFHQASIYSALPGQVSDHERRITVLEQQSATNSVRLDDRLDRIDGDLRVIFNRLNLQQDSDDTSGTNRFAASK